MFRGILVVIFILAFGVASANAANIITLYPDTVTVSPGSSATVLVRVDELPMGLSGYQLKVKLANSGIAEIIAVSYPSWAQSSTTTGVPSDSVMMSAMDPNGQIAPGATDVILAIFTVRGDEAGTTAFVLSDVRLDTQGETSITPVPSPETITQPPTTNIESPTTTLTEVTTYETIFEPATTSTENITTITETMTQEIVTALMTTSTESITTATEVTTEVTLTEPATTSVATVEVSPLSQAVSTPANRGISLWVVGCIILLAMSIALLVYVKVKKI